MTDNVLDGEVVKRFIQQLREYGKAHYYVRQPNIDPKEVMEFYDFMEKEAARLKEEQRVRVFQSRVGVRELIHKGRRNKRR